MANGYKGMGLTGKYPRKMEKPVATHLVAPVVKEVSLLDSTHPINDATKSGKQRGAVVIVKKDEKHCIAIATGGKPKDAWHICSFDNIQKVTPTR